MKTLQKIFTIIFVLGITNCSTLIIKTWEPPFKSRSVDKIRVSLGKTNSDIFIKTDGMIKVFDINDLLIKKSIDSITIDPSNLKAKIRLSFEKSQFNYKGVNYRGIIEIHPDIEGVVVVNILRLEDYLLAVVPSEMPANWPEEALKAQAICARTYAVNEILKTGNKRVYDVDATTNSQVYGGIDKENPKTDKAVRDTKGILAVYEGNPIQSFFHSNSGGVTEMPENVWGQKVDYLTSVESKYCKEAKNYSWKEIVSNSTMNQKLANLGVGDIKDIQVLGRTSSGRVDMLEVSGKDRSVKVKGTDFRKLLGANFLKSLRFGIKKDLEGFFIKGVGFGHGVGLSQWGSYGMAKDDYSYSEILHYYYKGIDLARVIEK
ncbi:MAG: SpoIID/LytB domain-containing protein [Leptospiraceae bacterium]|nr:SpoIID/LytB domain-containing protein [Leptospiraceae bacterium]MCK6382276.1 SpoIID/LytB domain-containing protein [Leptospiraceae bacterium]NUM41718.1 SpoIID/LytB domain-containing protein [Leptospiraceae bacterium]